MLLSALFSVETVNLNATARRIWNILGLGEPYSPPFFLEKIMEISWFFHREAVEKTYRHCGGSIIMEKMWRNHRESMESLWNFDGGFVCV